MQSRAGRQKEKEGEKALLLPSHRRRVVLLRNGVQHSCRRFKGDRSGIQYAFRKGHALWGVVCTDIGDHVGRDGGVPDTCSPVQGLCGSEIPRGFAGEAPERDGARGRVFRQPHQNQRPRKDGKPQLLSVCAFASDVRVRLCRSFSGFGAPTSD